MELPSTWFAISPAELKRVVHLIFKHRLKSVFYASILMTLKVLLKIEVVLLKMGFKKSVPKKFAWQFPKRCLTILKKDAWQLSPIFSGIISEIPKKCLKIIFTEEYRSYEWLSGIFLGLSGTFFWIVRHHFLDCQATFFWITRWYLGHEKEPKRFNRGGFRELKGVFVVSNVNVCYRGQHSDHVNHPFIHEVDNLSTTNGSYPQKKSALNNLDSG